MSEKGISNLLTTMMAVGGVDRLDVRDHRLAHSAMRRLRETADGRKVLSAFGISEDWTPDPEVGLRVPGLTTALWDAVRDGTLTVAEEHTSADFVLAAKKTASARRRLSRLPVGLANAIYRTGTAWAAASTDLKKPASATSSSVATRRAKRA